MCPCANHSKGSDDGQFSLDPSLELELERFYHDQSYSRPSPSSTTLSSFQPKQPYIKSHITDTGSWRPLGFPKPQLATPTSHDTQDDPFANFFQTTTSPSVPPAPGTNLEYQQLYNNRHLGSQATPGTRNTHTSVAPSTAASTSSPTDTSSATPSPVLTPQGAGPSLCTGGQKQFQCPQCPLSFRRNHDLKRHVKIHLPVRPYTCEYCSKAFNRKDALRRHVISKACKKSPSKGIGPSSQNLHSTPQSPSSTYAETVASPSVSPEAYSATYENMVFSARSPTTEQFTTHPQQSQPPQQDLSEELESFLMDASFGGNLNESVQWPLLNESQPNTSPQQSLEDGGHSNTAEGEITKDLNEGDHSSVGYWGSPWI